MYTAFEPSPAQAGTSNIIMANTSSSLCSNSNSGPTMVSTNSSSNLSYYPRPLSSPLQSVHSIHVPTSNIHSSDELHPPPIPLSPPLHIKNPSNVNADIVIKSSSSPRIQLPSESIPREDEGENFTSSSCLYNLDTVPPGVGSPSRSDHILRTSNLYLQNCGSDAETTQNMDINPTSDILMPSEYGNPYSLSSNRTQSIQDQSSQYPRFANLHSNPLDLQDHHKRINNNNNLVTGYNVRPPNSTATAFTTPSPSSDSHSESPTTPKMHSLPSGTKESSLLCPINGGNERQFERGNERDILSPSAQITSLGPYHLVGSPGTTPNYSMVDIGLSKNHVAQATHSKISHGKNGQSLENGSSTSLTPPNSATHLRKDCAASYGNNQLNHLQGISSSDDIMLDVSTGSASVNEPFSAYGNQPLESNLGIGKRMSYASPTITGTTTNSNLYSKASSSSLSPPPSSAGIRGGGGMQRDGHFMFSTEQIDCISDSLQQRRDYRKLECFLQEYSSTNDHQSGSSSNTNNTNSGKNGNGNSESVVRGMAAVAYENGNYRELYQIIESRDFDPAHHEELQRIWYEAHYKEAEGIRGRPLGKKNNFARYLLFNSRFRYIITFELFKNEDLW